MQIPLKDGRILDIETDDMTTALQATQSFLDREKARVRIDAEDKQRGSFGNFTKGLSDGTMQIASNIPLIGGFMDEGNAALITGLGQFGDYGEELEYQRERQEQATQRSRLATAANATAGTMLGGMGLVKAVPAKVAQAMPQSFPGRIGAGMGIGAAGGAIEGFGRGEGGLANRLAVAAPSALFGGVAGGLVPAIAKGIGMAWNGVASALADLGADAKSVKVMIDQLQANGYTPQQAQIRLQEMGPVAMPADITPGMQVFTGGTAAADPAAGNLIGQRLKNRREAAPARVNRVLDKTLGPPRDPYTQMQTNKAERAKISPQYETALTNAPSLPTETGDILARRLNFIGRSKENRAVFGKWLDQIDDALLADTPEDVARRLQNVKFGLAEEIKRDEMKRFGLSSNGKDEQKVYGKLIHAVDDILKSHIPGYREADEAFAPIARQQAAYDKGRKVLSNKISAAEHRDDVAGYSPEEKAMNNAGLRYEFDRRLAAQRGSPGIAANRILAEDSNTAKITASIGDAKSERLRRGIAPEKVFIETSNLAEHGRQSRTAVIDAAREFWGKGGKPSLVRDTINFLTKSPAVIRKTADNLTKTDTARDELIRALMNAADAFPRRSQAANHVRNLVEALLLTQAGRAGYETQKLLFGGPR